MTAKIKTKYFLYIVIALSIICFSEIFQTANASFPTSIYGRNSAYGFFLNQPDAYGDSVIDPSGNNPDYFLTTDAFSDKINSVDEFIQNLKAYTSSSKVQNQVGGYFIANTLLYNTAPGSGKTLSTTEWAELTDRLNDRVNAGKTCKVTNAGKTFTNVACIQWDYTYNFPECYLNSFYQGEWKGSNPQDDAFYQKCISGGEARSVILIIDDDGSTYMIMKHCGNVSAINPVQAKWNVPPSTSVKIYATDGSLKSRAEVGDKLVWTHTAKVGSGPTPSNVNIYFGYKNSQDAGTNYVRDTNYLTPGKERGAVTTNTSEIANAQTGIYCRATRIENYAWGTRKENGEANTNGGAAEDPTPSCVTVYPLSSDRAYRVEPNLTVDKQSATLGESSTFTYSATVTQGPTPTDLTTCPTVTDSFLGTAIVGRWLTYINGDNLLIPPNSNSTGFGDTNACKSLIANNTAENTTKNFPNFTINPDRLGEYCMKARIKRGSGYRLSSTSSKLDTSKAQTDIDSSLVCVNYSSRPRVEVWGGDLSVGKGLSQNSVSKISSGLSVKSSASKTYGSWIEYGIFSTGNSDYLGSAAKLNGGISGQGISCSQITLLTFSNSGTCGGNYNFKTNMRNYFNYFSGSQNIAANPLLNLNPDTASKVNTDTNNVFNYSGTDTLTVAINGGGAQLPVGRSTIIKAPNATVYISKDLFYPTQEMSNLNSIPQLIIIAKNIVIDPLVTNVDAWLLAPNGYISTCGTATEDPASKELSSSICSNKLTIDGPVVANKLYLFRTFNDIATNTSPGSAETIKLSSDAYLWLYNRSLQSKNFHSTYSRELPPRL